MTALQRRMLSFVIWAKLILQMLPNLLGSLQDPKNRFSVEEQILLPVAEVLTGEDDIQVVLEAVSVTLTAELGMRGTLAGTLDITAAGVVGILHVIEVQSEVVVDMMILIESLLRIIEIVIVADMMTSTEIEVANTAHLEAAVAMTILIEN